MTKRVSLFNRPASNRSASRSTALFQDAAAVELPEGDHLRSADSDVVAAALSAAHARMSRLVAAL